MKKAPKHLTNIDYIKCLREAQDRLMDHGILPIGPTSKNFKELAEEIAENLYKKLK
tara:strand:+ start:371 stop:538 length:168 start_codon:yes stop_codon:yes gene_type:complete